jgi:hypothetical protein
MQRRFFGAKPTYGTRTEPTADPGFFQATIAYNYFRLGADFWTWLQIRLFSALERRDPFAQDGHFRSGNIFSRYESFVTMCQTPRQIITIKFEGIEHDPYLVVVQITGHLLFKILQQIMLVPFPGMP